MSTTQHPRPADVSAHMDSATSHVHNDEEQERRATVDIPEAPKSILAGNLAGNQQKHQLPQHQAEDAVSICQSASMMRQLAN